MNLNIQWLTVIAIALVQGSISVAWIVYRVYLPKLFIQWGLTEELAVIIMIIEGFLGIIIEPFFGSLSDRQQRWLGTRFPLISLGVILASALLIFIPSLVIFGQPQIIIKWLLPTLAIAWALAMTMFRSPAIALLGISAPLNQLPLAISISTVIIGIIGAFRPIINKLILNLGEMFAFTLGSFILLGSVALLRQFSPTTQPIDQENQPESPLKYLPWSKWGLIASTALGMAWGIRFLMGSVTKTVNNPNQMIVIGIIVAIAALPIGFLTLKIGNEKAMLIGTIGAIIIILLLNIIPNSFSIGLALIILLGASNFLLNGTIPLVIDWLPSHQIGLGIGVYFGSFSASMSLFDLLLKPDQITTAINLTLGVIAFILVGICVKFGYQKSKIIDSQRS